MKACIKYWYLLTLFYLIFHISGSIVGSAEYGLIDNPGVELLNEPIADSKVIARLGTWEIVDILETHRDKKGQAFPKWYLIRDASQNKGWVTGNDMLIFTQKPRDQKYYIDLIWNYIKKQAKAWEALGDVKIKYLNGRGMFKSRIYMYSEPEAFLSQDLYKIQGDSLKLVLNTGIMDSIIFHQNYLIIIDPNTSVKVYDTTQKVEERKNILSTRLTNNWSSDDSYYKMTYMFHIRHFEEEYPDNSDSSIKFNYGNMEFLIYNGQHRGEGKYTAKYVFSNGLFNKTEE